MRLKTFESLGGGGVHQLNSTQNKPSMNLQLFADTSGTTSTDNSTTILTSTTNPMEGWIKGDIHCFVTNENNFLLVRLLSLLNNSKKVWDITYNTDGGVSTFKCLDGNGTGNGKNNYTDSPITASVSFYDLFASTGNRLVINRNLTFNIVFNIDANLITWAPDQQDWGSGDFKIDF